MDSRTGVATIIPARASFGQDSFNEECIAVLDKVVRSLLLGGDGLDPLTRCFTEDLRIKGKLRLNTLWNRTTRASRAIKMLAIYCGILHSPKGQP